MGAKKYNPNRVGNAIRPIIRESFSDDRSAAYEKAVHEAVGIKQAPQVDTAQFVGAPEVSGKRVGSKVGITGGRFAPQNKTTKFK